MEKDKQDAAAATQAAQSRLGRIFWGYGVIGFIAIAVLVNWAWGMTIHKKSVLLVGIVFSFLYAMGWIASVWSAANNYSGFSLWRLAAKFVAVLVILYWIAVAGKIAYYLMW